MAASLLVMLPMLYPKFSWRHHNSSVYNSTIYVSKNTSSTYEDDCGDWTNPCPTLFDISKLLDSSSLFYSNLIIHIIDGQNESRIIDIINQNLSVWQHPYVNEEYLYHPCLLRITRNVGVQTLTIMFDANTIFDFNDWFPRHICSDFDDNSAFANEYMFEVEEINEVLNLNIYNLIINDFVTESVAIAAKRWNYGTLACYNCTFRNIASSSTNALFHGYANIYLVNNTFDSVTTTANIIYSGYYSHMYDHDIYWVSSRNIVIEQSKFINIDSDHSLIQLSRENIANGFRFFGVYLSITDTQFDDISTELYVISDESLSANIVISDVLFDISTGSVYCSRYSVTSDIIINNVSVSTNGHNDQNDALFMFGASNTAHIYNMNVTYSYNANENICGGLCWNHDWDYNFELWGNTSVALNLCVNPTPLIDNYGHLVMNQTNININKQYLSQQSYWWCKHDPNSRNEYLSNTLRDGFIKNKYILEMYHMSVISTISHNFIQNERDLIIMDSIFNHIDDVNELHSSTIISQSGGYSTLLVYNSHFKTSEIHISGEAGTFQISHSVFESASHAMFIQNSESVMLDHCKVRNNGLYYGPFFDAIYENEWSPFANVTQSMVVLHTDDVIIEHNMFSGYNPHGLVYLSEISDISLVNNTFSMDDDELFYPAVSAEITGIRYLYSPLMLVDSSNVVIVQNRFTENLIDISTPWLRVWEVDNVCITGNLFNNTAFDARFTQITSCFRPDLSVCAVQKQLNKTRYYDCLNGFYGNMDESLLDEKNIFMVSSDHASLNKPFISGYQSSISLDNVHIIYNAVNNIVFATLTESILFLVDADMNGMNVAYNDNHTYSCNVAFNDRLAHNIQYISRFLMDCNQEITHHASVNKVSHSSITNIELVADSLLYYPGELLTFKYYLSDRMGASIKYDEFSTIFNLFDKDSNEFIESLHIENNECLRCDRGLFFNDIIFANDVGKNYTIIIESTDDLLLDDDTLKILITGCPVGSASDSEGFVCQTCNTDYYNLSPNNTKDCMSCDPDNNKGIHCAQGQIQIAYNHWMGFVAEAIISAKCPSHYCCANKTGCYYNQYDADALESSHLCAQNRDETSALCGKCMDGFSESLRSTKCVLCDQSFYFERMLYPLLWALFWAIGLMFLSSTKTKHANKKQWRILEAIGIFKYLSNPSFILMIRILFTRNIIYYQQALSQILLSNPFRALCEIFNLSISRYGSNDDSARCFIHGMNAKQKILMDLVMPIMVILFIVIVHLISMSIPKKLPVLFKYRQHNFPKCYSAAFVLMVGNILNVLFRLMNCKSIASYRVHYFFGNEMCYQQTWILCLLCLLAIMAVFILIMAQLKRIGHKARYNKNSAYYIFVDKYKPQCYWYEFVLFIRRICIAMFSVSFTDSDTNIIFGVTIFIFLGIQRKYEPFVVQSANQMECNLLVATVIVIMIQTASVEEMNDTFKQICVVILVLLPFVLLVYYILLFAIYKKNDDLSVSLLKKRLMYLMLGVIMYYVPKTDPNTHATNVLHDLHGINSDSAASLDDEIEVIYDDEKEDDAAALANERVKKLPKQGKTDDQEDTNSTSELEDIADVDSDLSVTNDSQHPDF